MCETKNNVWKKYELSIQNGIDNCTEIIKIEPDSASLNNVHEPGNAEFTALLGSFLVEWQSNDNNFENYSSLSSSNSTAVSSKCKDKYCFTFAITTDGGESKRCWGREVMGEFTKKKENCCREVGLIVIKLF